MDAAMLRLSQWINGRTPPPSGQPIDVVSGVIQRDSLGIALGGIRLPEMDVPTLTQQGTGNTGPGFCILFGREIPLPVSLSSLYSNHGKYVSKFAHATDALESGGFPLEPDARGWTVRSGAVAGAIASFREPERASRTDARESRSCTAPDASALVSGLLIRAT
jgi:hypothetical protein